MVKIIRYDVIKNNIRFDVCIYDKFSKDFNDCLNAHARLITSYSAQFVNFLVRIEEFHICGGGYITWKAVEDGQTLTDCITTTIDEICKGSIDNSNDISNQIYEFEEFAKNNKEWHIGNKAVYTTK